MRDETTLIVRLGEEPPPERAKPCVGGPTPEAGQGLIEPKALVRGVLHAVRPIDPSQLSPVAAAGAGVAYSPKSLLAIITYCYAMGILGSQDVERALGEDPLFCLVCDNDLPNWHVIRRFRRMNRHALHLTLHAACMSALRRPAPNGIQSCSTVPAPSGPDSEYARVQAMSRRLACLIEGLIEKAVWLDSLQLD